MWLIFAVAPSPAPTIFRLAYMALNNILGPLIIVGGIVIPSLAAMKSTAGCILIMPMQCHIPAPKPPWAREDCLINRIISCTHPKPRCLVMGTGRMPGQIAERPQPEFRAWAIFYLERLIYTSVGGP